MPVRESQSSAITLLIYISRADDRRRRTDIVVVAPSEIDGTGDTKISQEQRLSADLLFGLQVGILMGNVWDARTILLWVQIVMSYYHGAGVTHMKFLEQRPHGSLLRRCAGISGLTADVKPALVADADRVGVVVLSFDVAVGSDHPFRTAWLYRSVSSDHVVVADTIFPMVIFTMPLIYLGGRTRLVGPHCRTVYND